MLRPNRIRKTRGPTRLTSRDLWTVHSAFLPWHRLFIRLQEKLLQDECGYEGGMPYWDEQHDLEAYSTIDKASVWGDDEYSFGSNGVSDGGVESRNGTLKCVRDGPFANSTLRITQVWGVDSYDEYCLSRDFNQTQWLSVNQSNVDKCYATADYNSANFCIVDLPHSGGHLATGGTVSSKQKPPLFLQEVTMC